MTEGDPSWAGALAGVALGLPVFHVTELEVKGQVDGNLYEEEVGLAEIVLDLPVIRDAVKKVRERTAPAG